MSHCALLSLWQLLKSYTNPDFRFSFGERTIHPVNKNRSKKSNLSPKAVQVLEKSLRAIWSLALIYFGFVWTKMVPFIKYFHMCGTWDKLAAFVHWMKAEIKIQMPLTMRQGEIPGPTLMVPRPTLDGSLCFIPCWEFPRGQKWPHKDGHKSTHYGNTLAASSTPETKWSYPWKQCPQISSISFQDKSIYPKLRFIYNLYMWTSLLTCA